MWSSEGRAFLAEVQPVKGPRIRSHVAVHREQDRNRQLELVNEGERLTRVGE